MRRSGRACRATGVPRYGSAVGRWRRLPKEGPRCHHTTNLKYCPFVLFRCPQGDEYELLEGSPRLRASGRDRPVSHAPLQRADRVSANNRYVPDYHPYEDATRIDATRTPRDTARLLKLAKQVGGEGAHAATLVARVAQLERLLAYSRESRESMGANRAAERARMEEEHKQMMEDLRAEYAEAEAEAVDRRDRLRRDNDRLAAEQARDLRDLEVERDEALRAQRNAELEAQNAKLEAELAEAEAAIQARLDAYIAEHYSELSEARKGKDVLVERIAETREAHIGAKADHATALEDAVAAHKDEVDATHAARLDEHLDDFESRLAAQRQALEDDHAHELAVMRRETDDFIAAAEADFDHKLALVRGGHFDYMETDLAKERLAEMEDLRASNQAVVDQIVEMRNERKAEVEAFRVERDALNTRISLLRLRFPESTVEHALGSPGSGSGGGNSGSGRRRRDGDLGARTKPLSEGGSSVDSSLGRSRLPAYTPIKKRTFTPGPWFPPGADGSTPLHTPGRSPAGGSGRKKKRRGGGLRNSSRSSRGSKTPGSTRGGRRGARGGGRAKSARGGRRRRRRKGVGAAEAASAAPAGDSEVAAGAV